MGRSPTRSLQKALGQDEGRLSGQAAPGGRRACRSSRRCATSARDIKNHVLAHLDLYLEEFESNVTGAGRPGSLGPDRRASARRSSWKSAARRCPKIVTKGKSMIAEEIELNDHLEKHGIEPVETDLGEYIIQLRKERPATSSRPPSTSTRTVVADTSWRHTQARPHRSLDEPRALVNEAREMLRQKFLAADVGITGANFLIAETGSSCRDQRGQRRPDADAAQIHIVLASIEKVVPRWRMPHHPAGAGALGDGPGISAYTTFSTGPRRPGDLDGPEHYHVVILDNGRTACSAPSCRTCCAASAAAPA